MLDERKLRRRITAAISAQKAGNPRWAQKLLGEAIEEIDAGSAKPRRLQQQQIQPTRSRSCAAD
jgi:hypothetical protein